MTLEEMKTAIRLELTEAAASVFADAAIARGIQKCVALMSRLIPKKAVVESTIVIDVSAESITLPTAASATAVVNAQTLNSKVSGGTLTIADNTPDGTIPRRLTLTFTDAAPTSVTALTIIVKGYDEGGHYIEETWVLRDLPTTVAVQGDKYFKYVSEVEIDNVAGTAAAGDIVSVGTGNAYDADVYLNNKGLAWDSEKVTSSPAGTTYVRDTDYRINYLNGGIRYISTGSMAAAGTYLVTYKHDNRILDMSSLLPKEEYIRIVRAEYPVGDDPPTYITFDPLGEDLLLVKGSSVSLSEDYHIRIHYLKPWTAPAALSEGDYPKHLDNAVIIGATGQVLIFTAEKYVISAVAALAALTAPTAPTAPTLTWTEYTKAYDKMSDLASTEAGMLVDAVTLLTTGAALITTINDAERVAENYALYSQIKLAVVAGYKELANSLYDEQMSALTKFGHQVALFGAEVGKYDAQIRDQALKVEYYLNAAGRYLASGQAKINEFLVMLGIKPEFFGVKASPEQFS